MFNKKNILNFTFEELEKEIISDNEPKYRAEQIFSKIHRDNVNSFSEITNIPVLLRKKINELYHIPELRIIKITDSGHSITKKFLFEIVDENSKSDNFIETVLISEDDRNTICISTQIGCNAGCEFCATGKMGFRKNLEAGEIISQVYQVKKLTGIMPTNIVFMGMGEPFLNYDNLLKSLKILTHYRGSGIPSKRITVSTVGFKGKIRKFADDLTSDENKSIRRIKLALSLHSTDNGFRESIMPVSGKYKLSEIYKEISYFYQKTKNKITYEYIYFEGLNDTDDDVKRLGKVTRMVPSNLNVIPFHPIDFELKRPLDIYNSKKDINKLLSNKKLFDFIARLKNIKTVVNLRSSSGIDINAACGQLALKSNKNNLH
ncbi:MAG: 23S rRNA (adenine(2503)-C(2))-methyltransferase RlmN [Ignavibacteria bacterium]|nr:23S rRNA (adenine(2503)-C(2))-methyltransferase RlmN [Ignavibacteria bacterium]